MTRIVFLDTETTGLYPEAGHEVWDIGMIVREPGQPDREYQWFIEPDLWDADPNALRISRYYERTSAPGFEWEDPKQAAAQVARLLDGVHVVGMVPDFDIRHLSQFLRANGHRATHHYHLIDAETLAAGFLAGSFTACQEAGNPEADGPSLEEAKQAIPPWDSEQLSRAVGVDPDDFERHSALGDAMWARAIYDAVIGGGHG